MNFNYILQVVGSFSDSDFVNWASEQKIIQDINQLHFCSSCYNLMKLCYSDRYPDGAIFKCINRTCRNTMSIRFNSWISDAKISLKQFTVILACWSEGLNIKSTSKITIVSERTINNYFAMFRSIAEKEYRSDIDKHKLGIGIVQIDESHFFKAKYNVGSGLKRDAVWVFGEIDIETNRVVAEVCDDRSAETLIPIITSTVNSNAIIWSDKWKAYDTLYNYGFTHQTVNHSENFVDPITKVNTQKIESTWNSIKKFLDRNCYKSRSNLESYVHEWCFRRNIGNTFEKCWNIIGIES